MTQTQIELLERQATALTTGARAYTEIADELRARPTHGQIADECVQEIIDHVVAMSLTCAAKAQQKRKQAMAMRTGEPR